MTTAGSNHSSSMLLKNALTMWETGGIRRYYRGLTVSRSLKSRTVNSDAWANLLSLLATALQLGLVGVFPYAAIDMSTFETLFVSF